jgi:FdhD protein
VGTSQWSPVLFGSRALPSAKLPFFAAVFNLEALMSREASPSRPLADTAPGPIVAFDAATTSAEILTVAAGSLSARSDWLAIEEPLEIRARGPGQSAHSVAVTMRTPGADDELAVGFLFTESLIASGEEIESVGPCTPRRAGRPCNVVDVILTRPFDTTVLKRNFFATSSCGICGKASLEQVAVRCSPVGPGPVVDRLVVVRLPGLLRNAQAAFERTGGLHAAGLFDPEGRLIGLREDVGRHNAVDKLIGRCVLDGSTSLSDRILLVSGRTSFEILQKAAVAGIPIVCAVSAPSSLAVAVAKRLGITLIGFLRGQGFNIYTHPERIGLQH